MTSRTEAPALARRALRIIQADDAPLFLFSLTASEILADRRHLAASAVTTSGS